VWSGSGESQAHFFRRADHSRADAIFRLCISMQFLCIIIFVQNDEGKSPKFEKFFLTTRELFAIIHNVKGVKKPTNREELLK
jgi:hypothetical protein